MIHDILDSITTDWMQQRNPVLTEAFNWIRSMPIQTLEGISELCGSEMYVNVHGYETLPVTECRWESHRHTVDLQYCIEGGEIIEYLPALSLEPAGDYDLSKDTQKWRGEERPVTRLRMLPRVYALFLPNELHRPKVSDGAHPGVRKLVVKIQGHLLGV
jgi:biofilm protein TabA